MRLTLWVSLGAPCGQIPSHILRGRHISDRFSPGSRNHVLLFHIEVTEALAVQTFQVPSLLSWGFLAALLALDSFQNHPSPTHPTHSSAPRGPRDVRCWTWGSPVRLAPAPPPPLASVLSPRRSLSPGPALCPAHELVPQGPGQAAGFSPAAPAITCSEPVRGSSSLPPRWMCVE